MTKEQKLLSHFIYTLITLLAMLALFTHCSDAPVINKDYFYEEFSTIRNLRIDNDGEYHFTAINAHGYSINLYDEDPDDDFQVFYLEGTKSPTYLRYVVKDGEYKYHAATYMHPDKLYLPLDYKINIIED